MRANGTGARQVTLRSQSPTVASPYNDGAPGWSPNGRRLAFERTNNSTGHLAIFTVALTGRGLRRITPWRLDASQPQYSPHGRWIAFRSDETSDTSGNIWLVHPDGTDLHKLTHTPAGTGKWQSCTSRRTAGSCLCREPGQQRRSGERRHLHHPDERRNSGRRNEHPEPVGERPGLGNPGEPDSSQHADGHRQQRPILLAVDQGARRRVRVAGSPSGRRSRQHGRSPGA